VTDKVIPKSLRNFRISNMHHVLQTGTLLR
jgi:hypothetical protein